MPINYEEELNSTKLFRLTLDYAFKVLFGQNPDILLDMLNSFPEFSGDNQIAELTVLNPEIPGDLLDDKLSILDILAENKIGNKFHIEMQGFPHTDYEKRALYYWSKVYSSNLERGQHYTELKKVYSFNFLNFDLLKNRQYFHTVFDIRERKDGKIKLTDQLEIHIIELPKFHKHLDEISDDLDTWIYFIHESENLKGEEMETLQKRSSGLNRAVEELKTISQDKAKRAQYLARHIAELDHLSYLSATSGSFDRGKEEGIKIGKEEGIKIGEEKGALKEKFQTAKAMLSENLPIPVIAKVTGLSTEEIRDLNSV